MINKFLLLVIYSFLLFSCKNNKKEFDSSIDYGRYIDSCISYKSSKTEQIKINDSISKINLTIEKYVNIKGEILNKGGISLKNNWWFIEYPENLKIKIQFLVEDNNSKINQIIFLKNDSILEEKSKYYISNYKISDNFIEYNIIYNSFNSLKGKCYGNIIYGISDNEKNIISKPKNESRLFKISKIKYSKKIIIPYKKNVKYVRIVSLIDDRCNDNEKLVQNYSIIQDTIPIIKLIK